MFGIVPAEGRIVFIDTEFTTLDTGRREVWEIGLIIRDPGEPDVEIEWQVRPDLSGASAQSLGIGRYYRRCRIADRPVGSAFIVTGPGDPELGPADPIDPSRMVAASSVAHQLALILDDAKLVGDVVSADELALNRFLPQYDQVLTSNHRLRCVMAMAHGYLLGRREERLMRLGVRQDPHPLSVPADPWDPKELSVAVNVPPRGKDVAHRALVDARWARDVWDAITVTADAI